MDTAFSRPPSLRLHGSYEREDIRHLAERYGVTAWLVPSIWPETFSFVTHEMLATGLPVYGFDIGAQGEALRRAANGMAIPFDPDGDHVKAIVKALDSHRARRLAGYRKFSPGRLRNDQARQHRRRARRPHPLRGCEARCSSSGRSGPATTLTRDLLRRVPNFICPEETHFFRWSEPYRTPHSLSAPSQQPAASRNIGRWMA